MKSLVLFSTLAFASIANASIYNCDYDLCSWGDGCMTYQKMFQIEGNQISYWSASKFLCKEKDCTDIRNIEPEKIAKGTIEPQRLENGNYQATGTSLVLQAENRYNIIARELEVYASLMMGRTKGRVIEKTRYHHAKNPNREIKPGQMVYKCNLVR